MGLVPGRPACAGRRGGRVGEGPVPAVASDEERARLFREYGARATAQRATLESVMASMSDGLLVTDARRQVRFCNDRAAAALGSTPIALIDRPAEAIFAAVQSRLTSPDAVRAHL